MHEVHTLRTDAHLDDTRPWQLVRTLPKLAHALPAFAHGTLKRVTTEQVTCTAGVAIARFVRGCTLARPRWIGTKALFTKALSINAFGRATPCITACQRAPSACI